MFSPRRKAFHVVIVIASRPLPPPPDQQEVLQTTQQVLSTDARVRLRTSGLVGDEIERQGITNWPGVESTLRVEASSMPLTSRIQKESDSARLDNCPSQSEDSILTPLGCLNRLSFGIGVGACSMSMRSRFCARYLACCRIGQSGALVGTTTGSVQSSYRARKTRTER